eukprot:943118-Alexandrium_andersonii.AAC.1
MAPTQSRLPCPEEWNIAFSGALGARGQPEMALFNAPVQSVPEAHRAPLPARDGRGATRGR